jgi:hypothetical protein
MAYSKNPCIQFFKIDSLCGAIEQAANIKRRIPFQYQDKTLNIPIDLFSISRGRRIGIRTSLQKNTIENALIQNGRVEAVIKLKTIRIHLIRAIHICESLRYFLDQEIA